MDNKINFAISQIGYNPFEVKGNEDEDVKKLAEKNNISVEEAKKVLKEAEEKVDKNEQMQQQMNAMLELLDTQDEEEIIVIDDADFDNFLKESSPEQKMLDIFAQQQFDKKDNTKEEENNPFLKLNFQN